MLYASPHITQLISQSAVSIKAQCEGNGKIRNGWFQHWVDNEVVRQIITEYYPHKQAHHLMCLFFYFNTCQINVCTPN